MKASSVSDGTETQISVPVSGRGQRVHQHSSATGQSRMQKPGVLQDSVFAPGAHWRQKGTQEDNDSGGRARLD